MKHFDGSATETPHMSTFLYQIKLFQTQDDLGSSEELHRSTYSHPFLPFEKNLNPRSSKSTAHANGGRRHFRTRDGRLGRVRFFGRFTVSFSSYDNT